MTTCYNLYSSAIAVVGGGDEEDVSSQENPRYIYLHYVFVHVKLLIVHYLHNIQSKHCIDLFCYDSLHFLPTSDEFQLNHHQGNRDT